MRYKGQVSIEILILIAILIISAIVLTVVLINAYNKNIDQADNISSQKDGIVDNFVDDLNTYTTNNPGGNNGGATPPVPEPFNAWISSPANNSQHIRNNSVDFSVDYENEEGPVTCTWSFEKGGSEFTGPPTNQCNFQYSFSGIDNYSASVNISDGTTITNDSVDFEIVNDTALGSVAIDSPANNSLHSKGTLVNFTASRSPGAVLIKDCTWKYSEVGLPVTFSFDSSCTNLDIDYNIDSWSLGDKTITFSATQFSDGTNTKTDSIVIRIDQFPFTASILSPLSSGNYTASNDIDFRVDYSYNSGNVTCNWVIENLLGAEIDNFSGCVITQRISNPDTYNVKVTVCDEGSCLPPLEEQITVN